MRTNELPLTTPSAKYDKLNDAINTMDSDQGEIFVVIVKSFQSGDFYTQTI